MQGKALLCRTRDEYRDGRRCTRRQSCSSTAPSSGTGTGGATSTRFSPGAPLGEWMALLDEPRTGFGLFEDEWNHFDTLNERTKLLAQLGEVTQPWKTGLPVDFHEHRPPGPFFFWVGQATGPPAGQRRRRRSALPSPVPIRSSDSTFFACSANASANGEGHGAVPPRRNAPGSRASRHLFGRSTGDEPSPRRPPAPLARISQVTSGATMARAQVCFAAGTVFHGRRAHGPRPSVGPTAATAPGPSTAAPLTGYNRPRTASGRPMHIGVSSRRKPPGHGMGLRRSVYLADARRSCADVVAIASVSGGSIANGVVACRADYPAESGESLRTAITPALRNIANDGLFFFGPSTNLYIAAFLTLAGAHRGGGGCQYRDPLCRSHAGRGGGVRRHRRDGCGHVHRFHLA